VPKSQKSARKHISITLSNHERTLLTMHNVVLMEGKAAQELVRWIFDFSAAVLSHLFTVLTA
jgi:hypothetical protein